MNVTLNHPLSFLLALCSLFGCKGGSEISGDFTKLLSEYGVLYHEFYMLSDSLQKISEGIILSQGEEAKLVSDRLYERALVINDELLSVKQDLSAYSDTPLPEHQWQAFVDMTKNINSILARGTSNASLVIQEAEVETGSSPEQFSRCMSIDDAPGGIERIPLYAFKIPSDPIRIPVGFHILHSTNKVGDISEVAIDDQIRVLNDCFSHTSIRFTKAFVRKVLDDVYFREPRFSTDTSIKRTLNSIKLKYVVDPQRILNVFTIEARSFIGHSSFPWDRIQSDSSQGIFIDYRSIPGGAKVNYNSGKTLVHEVGHYLGLYHTFHGGCSIGDEVEDTPPQSIPTAGCPGSKDTCPTDTIPDLFSNYMDYSYDLCLDNFTAGQLERMNWAIIKYHYDFVVQPNHEQSVSSVNIKESD